jgi:outer membrane protein OmpA-like peptidoglycan-associated protein
MSADDDMIECSPPRVGRFNLAQPYAPKSYATFAAAIVLFWSSAIAQAGDPVTAQDILNALTPKPLTRSLRGPTTDEPQKQTPEQQNFVNSVRNRSTRSLTLDERTELTTISKDKPSIDIEIDFAYNSAEIGREASPGVTALGQALSSPQLASSTFVLAGHTDAKGSDPFNQDLSERRAESVKTYLIEHYKLPATNLISVGYGKTMLKNAKNPFAAENRRVQVINLMDKDTASK